ncbi:MAG: hypothetical protein KAG61_08140 [Bacteriovoracaceae bacterium]|nr:hypothetical protein [Bacteriovoracaceae bacterium]
MKLVLFTLLFLSSSHVLADINRDVEYNKNYRQLSYQLEDEQGDYALYARVQSASNSIFYATIGSKFSKQNDASNANSKKESAIYQFRLMDYEENYKTEQIHFDPNFIFSLRDDSSKNKQSKEKEYATYLNSIATIEGNVNPIKKDEFAKSLLQVMRVELMENGIEPTRGEFHKWSNNFKSKNLDHFFPVFSFSKLLTSLALGRTFHYMRTDMEETLANWMLSRPHNSITPSHLFRESYRINNGDVYKTLLTIENLLAYHWKSKNREQLGPILRLRPINNFYKDRGDKYGSWYHLFGMILYGYAQGELSGRFVSFVESLGSHVLGSAPEPQEDFINSVGGPIGAKLRKFVSKETTFDGEDFPEHLQESYYLNINEDYRAKLYFAHDSNFGLSFKKFRDSNNKSNHSDRSYVTATISSNKTTPLNNCTVEVFTINNNRNSNRLIGTKRASFIPGRSVKIKLKSVRRVEIKRITGVKVQISSCDTSAEKIELTTNQFF